MISDTIAILFVLLIVAAPIAGILLWARREDRETLTEMMEERIAIYEEAAEIIEQKEALGCCAALSMADRFEAPAFEALVMEDVFLDIEANPDQRTGYWMAEFGERGGAPEVNERRILALCFMMALIETGDA
jgi:hypothetical protein